MKVQHRSTKDQYRSTTIEKALSVLELFKEHVKLSFTDIQQELGMNKTTLFRILYTLEANEYLSRDENGRYLLGLNIFILGNSFSRGKHIGRGFAPYLRQLATELNLTSHLGMVEGTNIVITGKEDPPDSIKMFSRIGRLVPAHCTGQGKTILAYLPADRMRMIVSRHGLTRYTANTITNMDELLEELEKIRNRGYAFDNSEHEKHIRCVSVPVLGSDGEIEAALSVTGVAMEFDDREKVERIAHLLRDTVSKGRRELGFS